LAVIRGALDIAMPGNRAALADPRQPDDFDIIVGIARDGSAM
jgi:hypothetical protein